MILLPLHTTFPGFSWYICKRSPPRHGSAFPEQSHHKWIYRGGLLSVVKRQTCSNGFMGIWLAMLVYSWSLFEVYTIHVHVCVCKCMCVCVSVVCVPIILSACVCLWVFWFKIVKYSTLCVFLVLFIEFKHPLSRRHTYAEENNVSTLYRMRWCDKWIHDISSDFEVV